MGFLGEHQRLGFRLGDCLVMRRSGFFRPHPESIRLANVRCDLVRAGMENAFHPRQSDFRHQKVEQPKAQGEPDQHRRKIDRVERRKRGLAMAAAGRRPCSGNAAFLFVAGHPSHPARQSLRPSRVRPENSGRTPEGPFYLTTKSRRIAMRRAKMPKPSARATPMKTRPNWPSEALGLRSAPNRNWPKIIPTPIAAAPVPIAARPAPINLAAAGSIVYSLRLR